MEAVIATGGKQYCVTTGQVISVEKLPGEKGSPVEFKSVPQELEIFLGQ